MAMRQWKQKRIEIVMNDLRLVAYEGHQRVFEFSCVLGDEGTPTRSGHFTIKRKHKEHISGQSHHPMPYAMFFDEGRAIHASTNVTVRHMAVLAGLIKLDNVIPESAKIGSHGCVNLKKEDAARLFEWAPIGTPVIVR
jgi:lipoprotein-anchoring transpeptidase ErfK/SrfK